MTILSADSISLADFQEVLTRYQPLIDALSDSQTNSTSKKGKSKGKGKADETELGERKGELTLKELDVHRLVAIPARLEMVRKEDGELCLRKEEVEKLIRWKLKHGKYRPRLIDLVLSNTPAQIASTTLRAFDLLSSSTNTTTAAALNELVALKGIGPASASLLLSVRAPEDVPFFSDEAFRWVMFGKDNAGKWKKGGKGWDREIKYDKKEYMDYLKRVGEVSERLGVGAGDVEKAGWVLGRERAVIGDDSEGRAENNVAKKVEHATAAKAVGKRKLTETPVEEAALVGDLRRSKRQRK